VNLTLSTRPDGSDQVTEAAIDIGGVVAGDWCRFEFTPLADSAGNEYLLSLSASGGDEEGSPFAYLASSPVDGIPATSHDESDLVGPLAMRTYNDLSTEAAIGPPETLGPPLAMLSALDLQVHNLWLKTEADRRTFLYKVLNVREWLFSPLPPVSERPWPPDAPRSVKLTGALRHYGPISLMREALSWFRWKRMSPEARDDAVEADGRSSRR
jgi:hypothetical protein